MTRRTLVLVCCLLLSGPSPSAQTAAPSRIPITGTWAGELSPQDAPRTMAVTMELKFDGKGAVTGTVSGLPNPADVKAGSFDPKIGRAEASVGQEG